MREPEPRPRCPWCGTDPLYVRYHDEEWGVPLHDDQRLFEFLILEGAQAGLSWLTILRKREAYRRAFAGFDMEKVARFDRRRIERLLADPGIVRNRLKIASAINNARCCLQLRDAFGSLDAALWRFTEGQVIHNRWRRPEAVPTTSPEAQAMSRDLKSRGLTFVGPTICYAFMQATGMVNDHLVDCYRHAALAPRQTPSHGP